MWRDAMSAVWDTIKHYGGYSILWVNIVSTFGVILAVLMVPLCSTEYPPHYCMASPTALIISLTVLMVSPNSTEHPP